MQTFQHAQNWKIIKRALNVKDWRLTVHKKRISKQYRVIQFQKFTLTDQPYQVPFINIGNQFTISGVLKDFAEWIHAPLYELPSLMANIHRVDIQFHPFFQLFGNYPYFFNQGNLPTEIRQFSRTEDAIEHCQWFHSVWFEFATRYKCDSQSMGLDGKTLDAYNKQVLSRNNAIKKYLRSLLAKHPNGSIFIELLLPKECNLNSQDELEEAINAHQKVQTEFLDYLVKHLPLGPRDGYIWQIMPFLTQRNMLYSRILVLLKITDENVQSIPDFESSMDRRIKTLQSKILKLLRTWLKLSQSNVMPSLSVNLVERVSNEECKGGKAINKRKKYQSLLEDMGWFNDAFVLNAPNKRKTIGFRQLK